MQMYSQNNEERIILNYFEGHTGRLLDIGAYDGKTFSNSLALLERGWHGVLIEASPATFVKLQDNVSHLNVELINSCIVVDNPDLVTFYDNTQATATINEANVAKWKSKTPFKPIHLMTTNVDRIIKRFGINYDMVNIDVEGGSVELFMALVPRMPDVSMWIVEHDGMIKECNELMKGWKVALQNGENIIYIKP